MAQIGNAANSKLNGEWAKHVRKGQKKSTSGKRRMKDKQLLQKEIFDNKVSKKSGHSCWGTIGDATGSNLNTDFGL